MSKKQWTKPEVKCFGTIEQVTQVQMADLTQRGQFIIPGEGLGLFASLQI